jgi:hypothetical protein
MANYNKSFNFRNGVQVDDDNFIVNANGLVGIGTSIPTEFLDVHGTAKITGLVTATNLTITGVSTFYNNVRVGSGITLYASTGIISATTFYGDGSNLLNVEQVAVDGWIVNAGNLSTTSKVGIGTTLPYYSLQVGQDPLTGNGFSVDAITGNVNATGILTAPSFVGNLTGNVLGNVYGNIESIGVSTFATIQVGTAVTISGGIVNSNSFIGNITGNINSTGISTFTTLKVGTGVTISGGIVTATSFSGPLIGNVTGNVTGIASTALTLPSSARISITSVNSGFTSTGIATVTDTLYVTGFPAKIGVGTATAPEADIEVNKTGISSIRVISSNNNLASIGIGRSAEIRTGNTNTFYSYSTRNSLDIINSNAENVNYYLDYGSAGVGTGNFNWIYGQNPSSPLMSLTYGGNLGLGITNPQSKLYVVGTSYITGITTIDNDLRVNNDLYTGNLTFTGSITGNLGITTLSRLGISTNTISSNSYEFFVGGDPVFGDGVSITKTSIRASGNIQSTSITSTNINNTGIITSTLGFVGSLTGSVTGNVTGTATTAGGAFILIGNPSINPSSVGIGTTTIEDEDTNLYAVGNSEFYGDVTVSGIITATQFNKSGGTSAQFLKADGSVDSSTYLTSYTETDTLNSVTNRGNSTSNGISVGIITATGGFTSGIGVTNPVQITVSGSTLTFTVAGVGSTSLTLF